MLKKLRIEFIAITLILVGVVLAITLGMSYYSTYRTQYDITMESLERGLSSESGTGLSSHGAPDGDNGHGFMGTFTLTVTASSSGVILGKSDSPISISVDYAVGTSQTITTEIGAVGGLSISVSGSNVVLPAPVLNSTGTKLTSTAPMNNVTVTDQRQGQPGWSVSGQSTNFTRTGGGAEIDANQLGWAPTVVSSAPGQTVTAGATAAPGSGLGSSKTLGSAASGASLGTAVHGADLNLEVPTTTEPGSLTTGAT